MVQGALGLRYAVSRGADVVLRKEATGKEVRDVDDVAERKVPVVLNCVRSVFNTLGWYPTVSICPGIGPMATT